MSLSAYARVVQMTGGKALGFAFRRVILGVPGLIYDGFVVTRFVLNETWVGQTPAGRFVTSTVIAPIDKVVSPLEEYVGGCFDDAMELFWSWIDKQRFLLLVAETQRSPVQLQHRLREEELINRMKAERRVRMGTDAGKTSIAESARVPKSPIRIEAVTPSARVIEFSFRDVSGESRYEAVANPTTCRFEVFPSKPNQEPVEAQSFESLLASICPASAEELPRLLVVYLNNILRNTAYRLQ